MLRRFFANTRTRVLVAFFVLLALSMAVSVLALRAILLTRADDRVEDALTPELNQFRSLSERSTNPLTGRPFKGDLPAIFDSYLTLNAPDSGQAFLTFVNGRPYRASANAPPRLRTELREVAQARRPVRGEVESGAGPARFVAVPVRVDGEHRGVLAVAGFLNPERSDVNEAVRIAAGVSIIVALIASLLTWLAAGRALKPIRLLSDTARSIGESDLTRRIRVTGADEIAELARTFNAMLDRLETAFASQKNFLSDAGHELRTPITIIRGHLELLGDDPAERRETIAVVEDELDRMSRLVDDLLLLARAERSDFLRLEPLDLDVLTNEIFSRVNALGERDWRLEAAGVGAITADRQRLIQAMVNLAQNAVQHTARGQAIELGTAMRNGHVRMWVRDHGPGIDPAERERIFERHTHGAAPHGTGLGLAIVRAIAEAHGGRIELDSRPGSGSAFTLVLPAEPPPETLAR